MANEYLASEIITALRDRGLIPASDDTLNDARLLKLLTDENRTYVTALLKECSEEYLIKAYDQSVTAGTATYRVPTKAVGAALRRVCWVESDGTERPLDRIEPEQRQEYGLTGTPVGYVFRGPNVDLVPSPDAAGTLRLYAQVRQSKIVASTAVGAITAINVGARQVTVSSAPSTFTNNVLYDLVRGTPHFDDLTYDQSATIAGAVLTFANALPSGLAVGDYVCLAGETPIPQIQVELHPLLAQRVAYVGLMSLGHVQKARELKGVLDEMRADCKRILTPRDRGASRYIINRNGPGWGSWFNRARWRE